MDPGQGALDGRNACTHSKEVNPAVSSREDGARFVGIKRLAHSALRQSASSESGLAFSLFRLRLTLACAILPPAVSWQEALMW